MLASYQIYFYKFSLKTDYLQESPGYAKVLFSKK
jgi:hypothetical protein